ncbi:MAG: enoyl-ACP reductase [Rickettsiaceae bacterium]|nr:enoyl-ACP reductase [Rickettsiaceae bacterium]
MTSSNDTKLLAGKRGLIMGVANNMSIAWSIASKAHNAGAELTFTYPNEAMEKRVRPLAAELGLEHVYHCNVAEEESITSLFEHIKKDMGGLDFIVHSVAFSDKSELKGRYLETSLANFTNTLHISCYSLVSITRAAESILNDNASILTLSYFGAEKVVPNYNVMGIAKAALEASVKYLAFDVGPKNIRVNAISAGPIRTLAASAIGDFKSMMELHRSTSPLKRNTTLEDVAGAGLYFLSDLSSGVTGEIHHVDAGYNIMGMSIFKE